MSHKLGIRLDEISANDDFWDTMRRKGHSYPEQDLLLAVLRDALVNYRKNLRRPNKRSHADRAWFFDKDNDRLFSFESVCTALGLNAERIRQHLLGWERECVTSYTPDRFAAKVRFGISDQLCG